METNMSKGDLPKYRIRVEDAEGKMTTIASLWATSKPEIFSVRLNMDGHELSGIMVPVKPKAETKPAAAKKLAA
jgi:hypothetical protein